MSGDHGEEADGDYTYAIIAIPVVFLLGLLGSALPPFISRRNRLAKLNILESKLFICLQGFAAGIVLAVAFVHSFPEGSEKFAEQEIEYPYGGVIALVGALLTLIIETTVHALLGGHSHGGYSETGTKPIDKEKRFYTEMMILLFGLSFHSLIVGFTLGISNDLGLFIAIIAHQFFEGLALGFRIVRADIKKKLTVFLLDIVFSLATPVGIAAGLIVTAAFSEHTEAFEIVQGVCDCLSAGILIYVGLVHMLTEEIEHSRITESKLKQFYLYSGTLLGAAVMCVIAIWA